MKVYAFYYLESCHHFVVAVTFLPFVRLFSKFILATQNSPLKTFAKTR